jgi:hypothetical protein
MKVSYLCALGLLLATFACSKSGSGDSNTNPTNTTQGTADFKLPRYGTAELVNLFLSGTLNQDVVTINNAPKNTSFTWEITGSNGMRKATDTTLKGTGATAGSGSATINANSLYNYKDGLLTINVRFNNAAATTISGTTKKEEFIIRSYTDLMAINDYTFNSLADTFVQAQDIAFPDTVLTKAAVKTSLKANYDGRGHKITNLTIVVPAPTGNSNLDFVGLFSAIGKQVTVKNIKLELSATGIKTGNNGVCGGITGINTGTILNCSVKGSIKSQGTGPFSEAGGIAGEIYQGRIIGCSFNGSLEGQKTGGISALISFSYLNMCYSNYSVITNSGGGLTGSIAGYQDGLIHDSVYNCYAYVKQATVASKFHSLFFTTDPVKCLYDGCYSNYGIVQPKTISYSTTQELTGMLLPLQVSNLPADIAAPPANKPFKSSTDPSQPPVLWWE